MKWNTIKYLFKEGILGLWKNRLMALASAGTIVLCLLILGMSYSIAKNIDYIMHQVETQLGISAYVNEDLEEERLKEIQKRINGIEHISEVKYVSKEEALKTFAQGQENDVLFEQFKNESKIFMNVNKSIQLVSTVIISCLVVIALLLITNTIKLTVYVRRREINIMKYLGATDAFIRLPFVVEGVLIGLIGCLIPIYAIQKGYQFLIEIMGDSLGSFMGGMQLVPSVQIMQGLIPIFMLIGIGIGMIGSIIAIRKHLKV